MISKLKTILVCAVLSAVLALSFGSTFVSAASNTSGVDPAAAGKPNPSTGGNCSNINKCDLLQHYINPFINFLAALVGVAVVVSIIIGGIQYGSSGGDPSKVTAAKNRIRNALVAFITFLFLYALLNFLIPGGLF